MTPRDVLRRYPLFALPPASLLDGWLGQGHALRLALGETVFQEGSPGEWAYLLLQGRVRILRRAASGREIPLGSAAAGDLFGEYALLQPGRNTATCRAASDIEVWRFPLAPVRAWVGQTPAVRSTAKLWLQLHFLLRHLRGESGLGFMSAPSALAMLAHLEPVAVPEGCAIQADGLSAEEWFLLEQGTVALNGAPLAPGTCFGEWALLGGAALPAALAVTPVRCLALHRHFFLHPDQPHRPRDQTTCAAANPEFPQRLGWIGQREASDCGAAALAMIASYFGLPFDVEAVRARVPVGVTGSTFRDLAGAAHALGLTGQAVRIAANQLGQVHLPAIAHQTNGHYVVLFRIDDRGILLGDPATGLVVVSLTHLVRDFSGNLLLLRPHGGAVSL
jgi:CRP-like cAMP-binding protein